MDHQLENTTIAECVGRRGGVRSFARGSSGGAEMAAIDVRWVDGVEREALEVVRRGGRSA